MSHLNQHVASVLSLIAGIAIAVGSHFEKLASWDEATTIAHVGSLMVAAFGAVVAWLGRSPLQSREHGEGFTGVLRNLTGTGP